jgi:hypothetical protein
MYLAKLRIAGGLILTLSVAFVLHLCGTAAGQSSGKVSKKPQVIEVDLNKLPPELAQQIRDSLRKSSQPKSALKKAAKQDSQDEGQSGFQGEQTGEHDDGKAKPQAKKGNAKREQDQSGQNEDEGNKKRKKKSDD